MQRRSVETRLSKTKNRSSRSEKQFEQNSSADIMSTSITTDVSNYEAHGYGDPNHRMKALTWQGKNSVKLGQSFCPSQLSFVLSIPTHFHFICLYNL